MEKLKARYDHGRWIVDCPEPHHKSAEVPERMLVKDTFVCQACFPGATTGTPEERAEAFVKAEKLQMVYKIEYPPNKSVIEKKLRRFPAHYMNWEPGMDVDKLVEEGMI